MLGGGGGAGVEEKAGCEEAAWHTFIKSAIIRTVG
jgi:hypothetical protein